MAPRGRMETIEDRVARLEKLLGQLATWVKFDLQPFAQGNKGDGDGLKRKVTTRCPSTSTIARCRPRRGFRLTARKSTAPRWQTKFATIPTPSPVVVGSDEDVKPGFGEADVKMEMVPCDKDAQEFSEFILVPAFLEDNRGSGVGAREDSENSGDDFSFPPGNSDSSPRSSSDSEDGGSKKRTVRSAAQQRRRPTLGHSGKPRYRKCAPLQVPPLEATSQLDPLIKMDNLSSEELVGMGVTIPRPRRKPGRTGGHSCPHCDLVFSLRREMWDHRRTHPRTRRKKVPPTWTCPHCPSTFRFKCKMEHHLKKHTGDRPFLCFHCGHRSKCLSSLKSHISLKHSTTPREPQLKCEQCDKLFLTKGGLFKHGKKDHGENGRNELEVSCHLCTLTFSDITKLRRHIDDIHENKRKYECHLCGQLFKRPNHLKAHVARHDNPNRRKRGPQRPMIRGQLIPQPDKPVEVEVPYEEEEGADANPDLKTEVSLVPPPDKEVILSNINLNPATTSFLIQGVSPHFQIQIQPNTSPPGTFTIEQNGIVKDFTMAYLQ